MEYAHQAVSLPLHQPSPNAVEEITAFLQRHSTEVHLMDLDMSSIAMWAIAPACPRPEPLAAIGLFPENPGRDQWGWGEDWHQILCSPTG